jgi:hypothetical protein
VLQSAAALIRTLLLGGALVLAGWWTWFLRGKLGDGERRLAESQAQVAGLTEDLRAREARIEELGQTLVERDAEIEAQRAEILALGAALELLKVDHRLAEIRVLDQGSDSDGAPYTRVQFVELGPDGEPLGEGVEAIVRGRTVYVETLVIKFDDSFVESGDALRGTSICLFRRLFGEDQRPTDGIPIDTAGEQPLVYAGDEPPPPLHRDLWNRFWEYANDPELASERGVRAIHGEAPFIELRPGRRYRVELRASGGLSIRTLEDE